MNMQDRFDKFTMKARRALANAQTEAQRFKHNYIGTEHLLLGLIKDEDTIAIKILTRLSVSPEQIRNQIEFIIGRGDRIVLAEIGLTPRSKKVIELAADEARRMNHHYIGTEHILLGLVKEGQGIAAGVLQSLGVRLENARTATIAVLQETATTPDAPPIEETGTPTDVQTPPSDETSRTIGGFINQITAQLSPRSINFGKFTPSARRVLSLAQEEAQRLQHNYIGTEHLLLGLLRLTDGTAAQALNAEGLDLQQARTAVEFIIGRGDRIVLGAIGPTPRVQQVLRFAVEEAATSPDHKVETEHILLGIVRESDGIANGIIQQFNITPQQLREQILKLQQMEQQRQENRTSSPPPPPEAASLVAEGEAALVCNNCGARSPQYFNYCFNCGLGLK
ncbi:MAG TPA: Clp protease N-terminal domain-containing protein [Ktedonobacteraceae bacterium]|nr:Clp protease N-terminal domain-containing protein [Ktedonobacteraceae bacterium]